jgi:hypothetical protein
MFSWLRTWRASRGRNPAKHFHEDVLICTEVLGRKLLPLGRRYSLDVLAVALAMHLRSTIALGLQSGQLSSAQAKVLLDMLSKTEASVGPSPPRD